MPIADKVYGISVQDFGGSTATLNFYGGSIVGTQHDGLIAEGNAVVNIYGGTFSGSGSVDLLSEFSPATITLYGNFSQYGPVTNPSGSITGTLADNSSSPSR